MSDGKEPMTVAVLIGNSDDKLTQREWSEYVEHVRRAIQEYSTKRYFQGFSLGNEPWQNSCFVFDVDYKSDRVALHENLMRIRERYRQDSVAWLEGTTDFV